MAVPVDPVPIVTTRSGVSLMVVLPKACLIVTGKAPSPDASSASTSEVGDARARRAGGTALVESGLGRSSDGRQASQGAGQAPHLARTLEPTQRPVFKRPT